MSVGLEQLKRKYQKTFPQKLVNLKLAREKEGFDELHSLLHKLAGSSGSYGFMALSLLCSDVVACLDEPDDLICPKKVEQNLKEIFSILEINSG